MPNITLTAIIKVLYAIQAHMVHILTYKSIEFHQFKI